MKGRQLDGLFIFLVLLQSLPLPFMNQPDLHFFSQRIAAETNLPNPAILRVLSLFAEGSSLPFIARYRKEATGGLDELELSLIQRAHVRLTELVARKEHICKTIEEAGAMTPELHRLIQDTWDPTSLEDLFLPYKKKRKTRASIARDRGLEPLAMIIRDHRTRDLSAAAAPFLGPEVPDTESALSGARDILAEWISDDGSNRERLRERLWKEGQLEAKKTNKEHPEKKVSGLL
ncbi:MAG: hypothetical protein IPJ06_13485 [Saprospiraceae bacterium]|nr:hypothetical protein [Saprospiraceae bacterium]